MVGAPLSFVKPPPIRLPMPIEPMGKWAVAFLTGLYLRVSMRRIVLNASIFRFIFAFS